MLLVLYMEYRTRCFDIGSWSYKEWLDALRNYADELDMSFGDMVRDDIDPTYVGA